MTHRKKTFNFNLLNKLFDSLKVPDSKIAVIITANTGIPIAQNGPRRWRGECIPDFLSLAAICSYFNVPMDDFINKNICNVLN